MTLSPGGRILERKGIAQITEEFGWWLKGRVVNRPDDISFELSFEDYAPILKHRPDLLPAPSVPVTYLGLWEGRRCHAEFQMGFWSVQPKHAEYLKLVAEILLALQHHKPYAVADQRHRQRQLNDLIRLATGEASQVYY